MEISVISLLLIVLRNDIVDATWCNVDGSCDATWRNVDGTDDTTWRNGSWVTVNVQEFHWVSFSVSNLWIG